MKAISEFQPVFAAGPYLVGHRVIIVRAYNGARPDNEMPGRRDYVRAQPFTAIGYYCYLQAGIDPAEQARGFIGTVGTLQHNEFPILDHEEGVGNQIPRAEVWLAVVDRWAGFQSTLYSGDAFLHDQLGGPARWKRRPLWIASYPNNHRPDPRLEPDGCAFWQYSDREQFPGLAGGVDGSVYRGDAQAFLRRIRPGTPVPPALESGDQLVAVGRDLFVERDGEVLHAWRRQNGVWSGWQSFGVPGG